MKLVHRLLIGVELILVAVMLGWGLQLATPPSTFDSARASYSFFTQIAPEGAWATIMIAAPLVHLWALLKPQKNTRIRQINCLVHVGIWLFVFLGFVVSNADGTGWIAYLGYAALAALAYFYLGEQRHGR